MKFSERYHTISGEGVHAGILVTIVRLQGCNLKCAFCDTKEAWDVDGGVAVDPVTLSKEGLWAPWVLITGGEPLLQAEEVRQLMGELKRRYGVAVEIETNGSFSVPYWWMTVDSWSADIKCPSSGMAGRSSLEWLKTRKQDQVKFVVACEDDLRFVDVVIPLGVVVEPVVLISPTYPWTRSWLQRCADYCMGRNFRLSLQLHKIVYGERKGV